MTAVAGPVNLVVLEVPMRWVVLVAVGCGGDGSGSGDDGDASGPTSPETFILDYSEASCEWLRHCSDSFSSDYASESDCVDAFVADFEGEELPDDCDFDQADAQSCIDQIRENDCENDVFEGGVCYRVCGGD